MLLVGSHFPLGRPVALQPVGLETSTTDAAEALMRQFEIPTRTGHSRTGRIDKRFFRAFSTNQGFDTLVTCGDNLRQAKEPVYLRDEVNGDFDYRFCWGDNPKKFFDSVRSGEYCHNNWFAGALGPEQTQAGALGLPAFPSPAPALFGFEDSIYDHCSASLGANVSMPELANMSYNYADFDELLAHRCVAASRNILRLKSVSWHMCHNLRWGACAAQGATRQLCPPVALRTSHSSALASGIGGHRPHIHDSAAALAPLALRR